MESPSINYLASLFYPLVLITMVSFVVWFIRAFLKICVCVCLESSSASCHVFWGLHRQKLCLKRRPLGFISPLPALEPEPHFVTESSVCDIPAPRHCSSWWCHKWRIMILAGGTDEVRRNKDLLCLQLSLIMGRWGWEVKHWASDTPHDDRTISIQNIVKAAECGCWNFDWLLSTPILFCLKRKN